MGREKFLKISFFYLDQDIKTHKIIET